MRDHGYGSGRREPHSKECFCYLACDPFCRRIFCDVDPYEVSTFQPHDDEGIEQIETNGRDNLAAIFGELPRGSRGSLADILLAVASKTGERR
jgi:hypothetical protein